MANGSFSFPELSNLEILTCLSDLDIPLNEAELKKPTAEAMRPVYESFLNVVLRISREDMQQVPFAQLEGLPTPELFEEGIANLAFTRACTKMLKAAGIKDFTMQDVYKPELKRTKKNLCALINLAKYSMEKMSKFDHRHEQRMAKEESLQQMKERQIVLLEKVQMLNAAREAEEPAIRALEQENAIMTRTLLDLNRKLRDVKAEMRILSPAVNELKEKIHDLRFQHSSALAKRNQLLGQIVEAPEKLQEALTEVNANITKERACVAELDRRSRELQTRCDGLAKAEKEVRKCTKLMEEAEAEYLKYKEVSKATKGNNAKIAANEEEVQRLLAKIRTLQRYGQSLSEKLQKSELQATARKEAATRMLEEVQRNKAMADADYAAAKATAGQIHGQVNTLKEKIAAKDREFEKEEDELVGECQAILEQFIKYKHSLVEAMKPPPPLPTNSSLEDCLRL